MRSSRARLSVSPRRPAPPKCSRKTAKGKRCKGRVIPGTNPPLCNAHLGVVGRKSALTDEVTARLVNLLNLGNYLEVALAAAGVARSTFYGWIERGDPECDAVGDASFREFRECIEKARAEGEARNVTLVAAAAAVDWKAAAWMLERQFPDRWARPPAKDRSGDGDKDSTPSGNTQADDQDPFSALEGDEVAQRRVRRRAS